MNKLLVKLLLLVISICIAVSAFAGCSKEEAVNTSSNDGQSQTEAPSADPEDEAPVDDEPTSSEDMPAEDNDWSGETPDDTTTQSALSEYYVGAAAVKNSSEPIMTDYRGYGSIVHQMYEYMPYKNKKNEYTEAQAQEQFNRMQTIGIDLVRSDWNTYMTYVAETDEFDFENTEYVKAFYKSGLELKKRNIDVGITTGWSHHALVDNSSTIDSIELYVDGDWKATLNNWKVWMEKSILNFRSHGLTNLNTLFLFTEPGKISWNDIDAAHRGDEKDDAYRYDMYDKWIECAKTLDASLKAMGLRDKYILVGPNQVTNIAYREISGDFAMYVAKNGGDEYIDVYSSHNYVKPNDATQDTSYDFMEELYPNYLLDDLRKYSNKPFWIDEWNVGESDYRQLHRESPWRGTQLGVCATAIMEFGIQNSVLWTLYSQQWPNNTHSSGEFVDGIQMCGLAYALNLSSVPTTQYYAFALLSRFLSTTDVVYRVEYDKAQGLYYAFATNDNGDVTIIVVNAYSGAPQGFELSFEKKLGDVTLYRHLYDPTTCKANGVTQILPPDRAYKNVDDKLVDLLPAGGLAVYTNVKA